MRIALLALLIALPRSCTDETAVRVVHGTFHTTHWTDNGAKTAVNTPAPPGTAVSAMVLEGSTYQFFPGSLAADGTFTIPGVPEGLYFLQVDYGDGPWLYEMSTSAPDLGLVTASRPDVVYPRSAQSVTLQITNLDPWTGGDLYHGDLFRIASAQAGVGMRPFHPPGNATPPADGATSHA